jgi:hypothetical protein
MVVRQRLFPGVLVLALLVPAAAQASPGDLYVGDPGVNAVIRIDHQTGKQKIVASAGKLVSPDSGDFAGKHKLFIADYAALGGDGAVFRVNTKTGGVATVSNDPKFKGPTDVAVASKSELDAVDPFAGTGGLGAIFDVNPKSGGTSILSEDQHFNGGPLGIAPLPNGKLLVSDQSAGPSDSGALLKVNPGGGNQSFVTKGGHLDDPYGMTLTANGKTAYLADNGANRIVRVTVSSGAQKVVAHGGKLDGPTDVTLGLDGKLYVANDGSAHVGVLQINRKTGNQKVFASGGKLSAPEGITVQPAG